VDYGHADPSDQCVQLAHRLEDLGVLLAVGLVLGAAVGGGLAEVLVLRVDVDLETRRFTGFQCNEFVYSGDALSFIQIPAMPNLFNMLNTAFWVETDVDKRAFLYLDSVLLSGDF
jgi:hypothetical protein